MFPTHQLLPIDNKATAQIEQAADESDRYTSPVLSINLPSTTTREDLVNIFINVTILKNKVFQQATKRTGKKVKPHSGEQVHNA